MPKERMIDVNTDDLAQGFAADLSALARSDEAKDFGKSLRDTKNLSESLRNAKKLREPLRDAKLLQATQVAVTAKLAEFARLYAKLEAASAARLTAKAESIGASATKRRKRIEALVRGPIPGLEPRADAFIISGRVRNSSNGNRLPNVVVRAEGRDEHEETGVDPAPFSTTARTTPLGQFGITIDVAKFRSTCGDMGKLSLMLLDEAGAPLPETVTNIVLEAGNMRTIDLEIDGGKLPKASASAASFSKGLENRVGRLKGRAQRAETGLALALLRRRPVVATEDKIVIKDDKVVVKEDKVVVKEGKIVVKEGEGTAKDKKIIAGKDKEKKKTKGRIGRRRKSK